jgi:hypothetical protein
MEAGDMGFAFCKNEIGQKCIENFGRKTWLEEATCKNVDKLGMYDWYECMIDMNIKWRFLWGRLRGVGELHPGFFCGGGTWGKEVTWKTKA